MKILLVFPTSKKIWLTPKIVPLGIAYIASVLEKEKYDVSVLDLQVQNTYNLKADIVAFSATTATIETVWELAKEAKKNAAITILGGVHATCLPDESLSLPQIDFVVKGEGEETVIELVNAIKNNLPLDNILGLSYKKNKEKIHNQLRPFINDLDKIPFPAYHLFPGLKHYTPPQPSLSRRKPALNIMTSRGCPYDCVFCYKGTFGRKYRVRSVENVVKEWEYLVKSLKVKEIGIQDDLFNFDLKRSEQICELIIEKNLQVPWSLPNGIRADNVTESLLKKMEKSGCYRLAFGVESGEQKILDSIGKNLKINEVEKAFSLIKKTKIKTIAFFVLGNPGEDETTMRKTIDFAIKLDPDYAQFTMATPYPGTRLLDIIKKEGELLIKDYSEYSYFTSRAFYKLGNITPLLLGKMSKLAYRKFVFRPKYILRQLKDKNTYVNILNLIKSLIKFI